MSDQPDPLWAPGLKTKKNKAGEIVAYYWSAANCSRHIGDFTPKLVRLHHDSPEARARRCQELRAELLDYLSGMTGKPKPFDGTVGSLIDVYMNDPDSPYQDLKYVSRNQYRQTLLRLTGAVGTRRIDALDGRDMRRWYNQLKVPTERSGGRERVRNAHFTMTLWREVVAFGFTISLAGCERLSLILSRLRFANSAPRTAAITYEQAVEICNEAMRRGRLSIALAQALQFDFQMRQIDVIGEWLPSDARGEAGGIVCRGRRWGGGLTWDMIDANGILFKQTTKRTRYQEPVYLQYDTKLYPFARTYLDLVPAEKRVGPVVVSEFTGRPFARSGFTKTWRQIATAAGLPTNVWNRDSRAGGITEGSDAGADKEWLRHHAGHRNARTTERYNRGTLEKTRKVAELRIQYRASHKNED